MRAELLDKVGEGKSFQGAAKECGISRSALYQWRKDDAEFEAELVVAYEAGTHKLEDIAYQRATVGDPEPVTYQGKPVIDKKGNTIVRHVKDNSLLEFLIKKRNNLIGNVHVSGPGGGPIPILAMSLEDAMSEAKKLGLVPSKMIDL